MLKLLIDSMIFCGAALMVYNIWGFVRFARNIRSEKAFEAKSGILYIPIALLLFFLLGYLFVGFFGNPDIMMAGILFGGSIFVFIMYLLLSNVTRRILEAERLQAKLMASEEANRAKSSFLASVSHEMRTPMNVILGLDSLALRSPDLSPETRAQLEKIGQSGQHLLGLINNILSINQIGSGERELRSEPFSMAEALGQVNTIAQALCEEKGLTYRAELGRGTAERYVGDAMQLKSALLNILDNAVKYTDAPGTVTFTAECLLEDDDTHTMRFAVADTGVGIDGAFLPRVFDVFSHEDESATNRFGGSGIGLAVTKRTVELMGGTVTAESEKNAGSVFTVTVPLHIAEEEQSDAPLDEVSLAGRRVLIVEDMPENAEIVQDLLELEEIETELAENGQIALDRFGASPSGTFDAILMDLRMPVMGGLEAARRIRALPRPDAKTVPIIALTANAFESDVRASMEAGMNVHLAKPTDATILYDTLKRVIAENQRAERNDDT